MEEEKLNFEKLEVYQKTLQFVGKIYTITKTFPKEERYGLIDQLRRASVSILANIAEGSGRYHKNDMIQFLRIARSSGFECIALLQISNEQKYIVDIEYSKLYKDIQEITKMISGFINSIK